MRQVLIFTTAALLMLQACKKQPVTNLPTETPETAMIYKDLQDAVVSTSHSKSIDIENDGITDFSFGVMLLGDPILQRDRLQFFANSKVDRNLLNDDQDQSPILNKTEKISVSYPGYTWYEISNIVLVEKIITNNGSYWDGLWKNASHHYLPIQIKKDKKLYNGWIELSFDTSGEKLILHKAGLSTEADKDVKAGE